MRDGRVVAGEAPADAAARPRLAFFTPLPPAPSGIAQYSAELLPLLGTALDLDVYVDGYTPTVTLPRVNVLPASRFVAMQRQRPYDGVIYQMGNSPAHAYMVPLLERHPGLLVLHDYVLHHLRVWLAVHQGQTADYAGEMERRYGAAGAAAARQTLRGQMPGSVFDYPLCERMVEASPLVAVHSHYARQRVLERVPGADVSVLPMGVPLYRLPSAAAARQRLNLPATAPVLLSLGEVTPHKRVDGVLRALVRLRTQHPDCLYVVAGRESPGLDLERQARMLGLEAAVRRLGFVPEESLPDLLAAADVVINLRYPTAGETSASLLRILAAGKAVIVTRAGSMAELPADARAALAPDGVEEELLAEIVTRLLVDRPLRHTMEANALRFIQTSHTLPAAARAYLDLIGRWLGRPLPVPDWPAVEVDGRAGGATLATAAADLPAGDPPPANLAADAVAAALCDLGLAGNRAVTQAAARALAELGLAAGGPTNGALR